MDDFRGGRASAERKSQGCSTICLKLTRMSWITNKSKDFIGIWYFIFLYAQLRNAFFMHNYRNRWNLQSINWLRLKMYVSPRILPNEAEDFLLQWNLSLLLQQKVVPEVRLIPPTNKGSPIKPIFMLDMSFCNKNEIPKCVCWLCTEPVRRRAPSAFYIFLTM